jgi:hypothetical protein
MLIMYNDLKVSLLTFDSLRSISIQCKEKMGFVLDIVHIWTGIYLGTYSLLSVLFSPLLIKLIAESLEITPSRSIWICCGQLVLSMSVMSFRKVSFNCLLPTYLHIRLFVLGKEGIIAWKSLSNNAVWKPGGIWQSVISI